MKECGLWVIVLTYRVALKPVPVLQVYAQACVQVFAHEFPQEPIHSIKQPPEQEPAKHIAAIVTSGFSSLLLYIKAPPFPIFL